jgi:regulator of protease activity HflC (stomatin/prohibitin superfamily)
MRERSGLSSNGWFVLVLDVALFGAGAWLVYRFTEDSSQTSLWLGVVALLLGGIVASGFVINPPNIAKVVTFFGRYLGTVRRNGLVWTVPLTLRERISLRIQNFDSETLKVNDANGNPVEVAAVIVWRVVDTAQAPSTWRTTRDSFESKLRPR